MADELAAARATIERQEEELASLRAALDEQNAADEVKRALAAAAAAGTLGSPVSYSELLRLIIETATEVIDAESAVLLVLDEEGDELVFDVTFGVEDEDVAGLRLPVGQGIAGLVAASGQPIAISDAASDPRVAQEIAGALDYIPQSILCVPLVYGGRTIGVLEVLERDGARSFTPRDIATLGAFAKQAAVGIRQSRAHRSLATLMADVLESLGEDDGDSGSLRRNARAFAARAEEDPAYRQTWELTQLVHEVSQYGEDEIAACRSILESFAEYLRTRPDPSQRERVDTAR